MFSYTTKSEQSLYDLTVQLFGDIDSLNELIGDVDDINASFVFNKVLSVNETEDETAAEFTRKGSIFATVEPLQAKITDLYTTTDGDQYVTTNDDRYVTTN